MKAEESSLGSEIDMSAWLDKPAGKRGVLLVNGSRFQFEDGTPIKFWGTNLCERNAFPSPEKAVEWANFLASYGFNAVRFHKFTWDATDGIHSTIITNDKWERFDRFCHELREKGIYYGWSHIYGHRVAPADSSRLLAYNEIMETDFPWRHLSRSTAALVNFADDLQQLNIELTVNMLNHINPYTGLRYADDPALNFIEFQNEDNIFWAAIERSLEQAPTYRKLLCRKFSEWLRDKYQTHEALLNAWNHEGLNEGEHLDANNLYPQPNHGFFSYEYQVAKQEGRSVKQHVVDKFSFLYEEQMKFYRKFEMAVRETGYKGPLIASCWQAGEGLTHLLNLHADYEIGVIDRHNYFGGGQGHSLKPGPFDNSAMVSNIGSGLFGTGLQQVKDRPFLFSEWMSLIPNEYTAESAPIVAVYGMGLQGWDGSYVFATDFPHYTNTIQTPWGGVYNATSPTQLALYPALAALVFRGDVKEGDIIVNRKFGLSDIFQGKTIINETIRQDHDRKVLDADFPLKSLAAGRVTLEFTENCSMLETFGLSELIDQNNVYSNTGQLIWSDSGKGYFTINTDGTKGLVGFAKDKEFNLGCVTISTSNDFAVILVTSLESDKGIYDASRILVTAIGRAKNTGMEICRERSELISVGDAPILVEPVDFVLGIKRSKKPRITILNHTGHKTDKTIKYNKRTSFKGSSSEAFYYLIEY
ncbi:hypothetical protein [Alkaliflexus imshenetskii]|uniref:hypothetical protein n=1 Tax=Alkaliflexus imshenetskii TaxID=286730 RepID=UPI0012FB0E7E|nr:hypothetical protein [Alkaliflexus imshenetskii]